MVSMRARARGARALPPGRPGAQISISTALLSISGIGQRLSRSALAVVRERNLALPGISGIGQGDRLPEARSHHFLHTSNGKVQIFKCF